MRSSWSGFSPDMSDPQKALEETQAKAAELEKLATSAPDEQVKKALEEAANGMQNVTSAADWVAAEGRPRREGLRSLRRMSP